MKKNLTFFLCLLALTLTAQDRLQQFQSLFQNSDTTGLSILLKSWQAESPNDAELYTSLFNYHFNKRMFIKS